MDNTRLLLSAAEASSILGVSRSTFLGLHRAGSVPAPVRITGCRRTLWRAEELRAWVLAGCPKRIHWKFGA